MNIDYNKYRIMKTFCDVCHNLLTRITTDDDLIYKCMTCSQKYKSDPDDTLIYEEVDQGSSLYKYNTILKELENDEVTLREIVKCPNKKCNSSLAKSTRIGDKHLLIYKCEQCSHIWGVN